MQAYILGNDSGVRMSQEHKLTLSRKKWCLWLAGLTSVPYVTGNISAPVIPGLIDTSALCVAIALVVLWDRYEANFADTETTRRAKIRGTLITTGLYSMLALTVIESISVIRGRDPLESELVIALNEWLSLVEFACFVLAALGWALASGDADHEDPLSRSHRPTLFCMGAILPMMAFALSEQTGIDSAPESLVLCGAFALMVLFVTQRVVPSWCPSQLDALLLLCGQLSAIALRSIVLGDIRYGFDENAPLAGWDLLLVVFTIVVTLPYLASLIHRERKPDARPSATDAYDTGMSLLRGADGGHTLTDRELEVLAQTLAGESARVIAGNLGIAESTVATFRRRGYKKLNVSGKDALLQFADDQKAKDPDPTDGSSKTAERKPSSALCWSIWICLFVAALVLRPPTELEVGEMMLFDTSRHVAWILGLILVAVAASRLASGHQLIGEPSASPKASHVGSLPSSPAVLPLCALSFPITMYFSWMQSPDYLPWAVLCLQLCPIALGMETILQSDGLPRTATQLIRAFEAGVDAFLFRGTDGVLLLGLSCIFSVQMGDMTFSDIPLYFCLSSIAVDLLCVFEAVSAAHAPRQLSRKQTDRALRYLEGRGLGELQARVALSIALGQSTREICSSCQTTRATVKSYRLRSYQTLGVHSARELREMLLRDTGLTT